MTTKSKAVLVSVVLVVAIPVAGFFIWNHLNYLNEVVHETARWAVIEDSKGAHMAVEPTSDEVWNQLSDLYKSRKAMWVGGIVERYHNKWGFRFKPETITVAEVTAEGCRQIYGT